VIDDGRIVHEVRYPHPVSAVWDALTDRAALASWLMANDFAPEVGRRFRFDATPGFGIVDGEVLVVEPPHLLSCRWVVAGRTTTVTFQLRADGPGTLLRLEHEGLGPDAAVSFDGGWGSKLDDDLPQVLAGRRDRARVVEDAGLYRHPEPAPRPRPETDPIDEDAR